MRDEIDRQSVVLCLLLGFIASYILFFALPVFLNSDAEMKFFSYVPAIKPIGIDLKVTIELSESWFISHQSPWASSTCVLVGYTPLTKLLFLPMVTLSQSNAYAVMTLMTLFGFCFTALLFPILVCKDKQISPVIVFMFVTGLFSYGLQFEIERGQFNVVAMSFCFLSIYLYHYHYKLKYLAYLLFSLSIQLKLYPAIFVFAFIRNPRDWKHNLKKFTMIGLFNLFLLFVLGWKVGVDYFPVMFKYAMNPYVWVGNNSAIGFFLFLAEKTPDKLAEYSSMLVILAQHPIMLQKLCLLFFVICFFVILFFMWKNKMNGLNVYLLTACIIGTLIIPSQSMDYKLSILAGPLALFFNSVAIRFKECGLTLLQRLMIFVMSASYFTTIFSYTNRPLFLKNSFPMLMILLAALMVFMCITERQSEIT